MKLLEKILLATDFSDNAEDAFEMAVLIAKTFKSEISLINVVREIEDAPLEMDMLKEAASNRLTEIQNRIIERGAKAGHALVHFGAPFDQIVHAADSLDVNLIIIGAKGRTASEKYHLGVTADRIARRADKPVCIVKQGGVRPIRKVLCPVDFSPSSRRAMQNAVHIARNFNAELLVLTVLQPLSSLFLTGGPSDEKCEAYRREKETLFDSFLNELNFHNVKWDRMLREGMPSQEIVAVCGEASADLLIMGASGRTGFSRILMGRVAKKVIREMPCSIITVKSEHPIRLLLETKINDIEAHFKQGRELLEKGFPEEAEQHFQHCLTEDMLFAPAWEGLAAANEQMGREAEAKNCIARADEIRQKLWEQKVVAEIRSRGWLFGRR